MDSSILPYLPHMDRCAFSSCLCWPSEFEQSLKEIEQGQGQGSLLTCLHDLPKTIAQLRRQLYFPSYKLSESAQLGYIFLFGNMYDDTHDMWFNNVFPKLARLLLKLPSLLEQHYHRDHENAANSTALRILDAHQPGVVCLDQELIAALLACSFLSLFPVENRHAKHLPLINFDHLFETLKITCNKKITNKLWCIALYLERIVSEEHDKKLISFERRVLNKNDHIHPRCLDAKFWNNSAYPLCEFKVNTSGIIEDQTLPFRTVYFAGKNFGRDALGKGTSLDDIGFMLSPELIAGMLFLPAMGDNEAVEIVGVERFSTLTGYKASFRFHGVYVDATDVDALGRRKTRIVAVDELCLPNNGEYAPDIYLREINKAYCALVGDNIRVATGDWEQDPSGEDIEMKAIIKWLAASQAQIPSVSYCTYGIVAMRNLDKVIGWILSRRWTVGDLWKKVIHYSKTDGSIGFFKWLQQEETPLIEHSTKLSVFQRKEEKTRNRNKNKNKTK